MPRRRRDNTFRYFVFALGTALVTLWVVPAHAAEEYPEIAKMIGLPDVRDRLTALGEEPLGSTPGQFAVMIRTETVKWRKIVIDANIKGGVNDGRR